MQQCPRLPGQLHRVARRRVRRAGPPNASRARSCARIAYAMSASLGRNDGTARSRVEPVQVALGQRAGPVRRRELGDLGHRVVRRATASWCWFMTSAARR